MGRFFYVNNVTGSDTNGGNNISYPYKSIDKVIDEINIRGVPGDTIRICYSGTDYTYAAKSLIQGTFTQGNSWDEGEYFTIEGYDPAGGTNRPKLLGGHGNMSSSILGFSVDADYWLIRDFYFYTPGTNLSWSAHHINISSSLTDGDKYFKVRNCYFEGKHNLLSTDHQHGIYIVGGSRVHVDAQFNVFKNLDYGVRMYTSLPAGLGVNIQHNIFVNDSYQMENIFYLSQVGDAIDFTFSNNTYLGFGPTQYDGYACRVNNGELTGDINFEIQNNFVYWVNYAFRKVITGALDSTLHEFVGYNTWGRVNSVSNGYYGDFDAFETESNYRATGDYNVHATTSKDDYTTWFADYGSQTYFWTETGWITTYDLRPIGIEMTGTMEDPINGLRGAIKYSGVYKDTTVTTNQVVEISPWLYATTNDVTFSYDTEYGLRGFSAYTFDLGDSSAHDFSNFGLTTDHTARFDSYTYKTGSYHIKHTALCFMENDIYDTTYNLECQTECRSQGPSLDVTSTSVEFDNLQKELVVLGGILSGRYTIELRVIDPRTKARSSWFPAYDYVIP